MLALSHKNPQGNETRGYDNERVLSHPCETAGASGDPWAAMESFALRPSLPEAATASEESSHPEERTSHLLKVLGGRRGPEAVVEARAVTSVAEVGVCAVGAIPGVVAVGPGQLHGERGEEVMQRPGDDDVVEEANVE